MDESGRNEFGNGGEMPTRNETKNSRKRNVISWGDHGYDSDEFRALLLKKPGSNWGMSRWNLITGLMIRSGLFETECQADCTGHGAEIGRMIILFRWERFYQPDIPYQETIADEQDTMNSLDSTENIDSQMMDPVAPGSGLIPVKTGSLVLTVLGITDSEKIRDVET